MCNIHWNTYTSNKSTLLTQVILSCLCIKLIRPIRILNIVTIQKRFYCKHDIMKYQSDHFTNFLVFLVYEKFVNYPNSRQTVFAVEKKTKSNKITSFK